MVPMVQGASALSLAALFLPSLSVFFPDFLSLPRGPASARACPETNEGSVLAAARL